MVQLTGFQQFAVFALVAVLSAAQSQAAEPKALGGRSPASLEDAARVMHLKELVGVRTGKKFASLSKDRKKAQQYFQAMVKDRLPGKWKKQSKKVAQAILTESSKYGFDPFFTAAVIENESSFQPEIVGSVGEIGLMQIRPETAEWIAKKFSIRTSKRSSIQKVLSDPVMNVRIGTAFLNFLRGQFDSNSRLYISAYNMGSKNVNRLVNKNEVPKEYAIRVMKRYLRYYKELKVALKSPETDTIGVSMAAQSR